MLSFKQACYNKSRAYSTDFKQRALDYIKEGHSHVEAAKVFDVGVRTLFTWEKKLYEQGHLERKKTSRQKAENSFRGIESLCRGSSRCFFTGNCGTF